MKMNIFFSLGIVFIISSCDNSESTKQEQTKGKNQNIEDVKTGPINQLKIEASRLRAGSFVKDVLLDGKKAIIVYVKDYNEYKEKNPQSIITESEFSSYWESGNAIEKALIDGSVRIMKKLEFVQEVQIILPFKDKKYSINVSKIELEKFVGTDFNSMKENWDKTFSNPYVYEKDGREKFFERFGTVEEYVD